VTLLSRALVLLLAFVSTSVLGAGSATSAQQQAGYSYLAFEVSGKVRCQINRDTDEGTNSVRCDVAAEATFDSPPRPSSCPADWGSTIGLDEFTPPGFLCVGDALMTGSELSPGQTKTLGAITCTGITDGVQCRNPDGYGFAVTPASWTWLRSEGKRVLHGRGIGKLRVGMSLARAKKTGTIRRENTGCTGSPQYNLKKKYQGAYVVWRKGRVDAVVAWSNATTSTKVGGVGVGSSLADARAAFPKAKLKAVSWPSGASALIAKRGKSRLFMLFTPAYGEALWSSTTMEVMVASRNWRPAKQLDFHGCGYGA
jgi:hypothetical protein